MSNFTVELETPTQTVFWNVEQSIVLWNVHYFFFYKKKGYNIILITNNNNSNYDHNSNEVCFNLNMFKHSPRLPLVGQTGHTWLTQTERNSENIEAKINAEVDKFQKTK